MRRFAVLLVIIGLVPSACAAIEERIDSIDFEVDLDAVMDEVRDCDRLAARFTGVIRSAAEAVDALAAANEGRVPETDITSAVDRIATSQFAEIAEQLGCAKLEFQVDMLERIEQINTETGAGDELLRRVTEELEDLS